jgi:hypothetical protein
MYDNFWKVSETLLWASTQCSKVLHTLLEEYPYRPSLLLSRHLPGIFDLPTIAKCPPPSTTPQHLTSFSSFYLLRQHVSFPESTALVQELPQRPHTLAHLAPSHQPFHQHLAVLIMPPYRRRQNMA